jgi:hypothetical protein
LGRRCSGSLNEERSLEQRLWVDCHLNVVFPVADSVFDSDVQEVDENPMQMKLLAVSKVEARVR